MMTNNTSYRKDINNDLLFSIRTILIALILTASPTAQSEELKEGGAHILAPVFQDSFDIPPPITPARNIRIWSTYYYTVRPVVRQNGVPFRDKDGKAISDNVSLSDWCIGAQEGSIKTTYKGKEVRLTHGGEFKKKPPYAVDCDIPFPGLGISGYGFNYHKSTDTPYGNGTNGWLLVPYRTMAAQTGNKETGLHPGDVIYVDKVRGKIIEDPVTGKKIKHDGYFFIGDKGSPSRIKGYHVDTFCGFVKRCLPSFTLGSDKIPIWSEAQIINDPIVIKKLTRMHLRTSYE
ncbi:hypothetical protein [Pantoea sp. SO10]|uniref:hypothetical protein n=1 Tax=Pantoea sp. SO10 TaxID=2575375 RepID=UPI0010C972F9|nr:hypothetical protein [Pantoea sp. SO10]QCP62353.1 hypothetical protein FCN45_23375 [Pantoea sp. SO10]